MGVKAELESVRIMGEQVPDLLHLHLDLCCHDICDVITEMPQIFPKLQILKVRWGLFVMNSKYIMSEWVNALLCMCVWPHYLHSNQLLSFRHHNVPESVFLQLQHLPRLEQLVILDAPKGPSPTVLNLTQKLHVQTNNRIQVLHFSSKDQTTCSCGFYWLTSLFNSFIFDYGWKQTIMQVST